MGAWQGWRRRYDRYPEYSLLSFLRLIVLSWTAAGSVQRYNSAVQSSAVQCGCTPSPFENVLYCHHLVVATRTKTTTKGADEGGKKKKTMMLPLPHSMGDKTRLMRAHHKIYIYVYIVRIYVYIRTYICIYILRTIYIFICILSVASLSSIYSISSIYFEIYVVYMYIYVYMYHHRLRRSS